MDHRQHWFAYFLAVVNATIIGLSFMATKVAVSKAPVFDTLAIRFVIGLTAFLVYAKLIRLPLIIRGGSWWKLAPIVLFYPIGFFTFQAFGLQRIPSSEAGIVSASAPVITAILAAIFIREQTNLRQFGCILFSITGVVFITWMQGQGSESGHLPQNIHLAGIGLIVLSCVSSAGYTICNRVLIRSFTAGEITFALMFIGTIFFCGLAIGGHAWSGNIASILEPLRDPVFVATIFYLGIFASLITTILASLILKRINSSQLVVFFNLATVVSILAGYFFMNEPIHGYHLFGTAMIIAGVVGTNFFKSKEDTKPV